MDCLNALRVYFGWDKQKGSEKGNKKTRYNFHEDYLFCIIPTESQSTIITRLKFIFWALYCCWEMLGRGSTITHLPK